MLAGHVKRDIAALIDLGLMVKGEDGGRSHH